MRCDSDLVLWTLRLHERNKIDMKNRLSEYETMDNLAKYTEMRSMDLKERLKTLVEEVELLRKDRPLKYIQEKEKLCKFVYNFMSQLKSRWRRFCNGITKSLYRKSGEVGSWDEYRV
jgi:hypothetical protein